MSPIELPIVGPGTQPAESDGMELDYMQLPGEMVRYQMPELPEVEDTTHLQQAKSTLETLLQKLTRRENLSSHSINLSELDAENLELVNQVLGEGDVSIRIAASEQIAIQESVLTGVWRCMRLDSTGQVCEDRIEIAAIPNVVVEEGFATAHTRIDHNPEKIPDGVMNSVPLIAEINDQLSKLEQGGSSHVINLSLLPQTETDLLYLQEILGGGKVTVLSRGYGNCRISSTNTKGVWWVQYFNSQDSLILNTLEISKVPEVACAGEEDLRDSAQRLEEILEVYR